MLEDDDLPVEMSYVPPAPQSGMTLTEIDARFEDGAALYTWFYEGLNQIFFNSNLTTLSLEGSLNQDPITLHPEINAFIAKYSNGWSGGRINWLRDDPDQASGRTGLSFSGADTVANINPLLGVDSYRSNTATYSYDQIYTKDTLPMDLVTTLGTISSDPPDVTGQLSPGNVAKFGVRNWLYSGVKLYQVGPGFLVRKSFLLSGLGGWLAQLYDPANALQSSS
jgi:hypothetical protein